MRREDREIKSLEDIYDVLERCDVIRIAMNAGDAPYVVPMTFGCNMEGGKIVIYFHSAGEGRKNDLLAKDPRVCVEADLYYQVEELGQGGITAYFESVIGTGRVEPLTEKADKVSGLKYILLHYKKSGFPVTSCSGLEHVSVFRIELDEVSGKHNIKN